MSTTKSVEDLSIDTIRTLAMDAVQKANAGHPGTAMALAPLAYLLYREVMHVDPNDPEWPNRDRFILSAGHACILQYAALHLTGFDLTLGDLESFRQWESRTPGHPELHHTPGVETTTGPLGQGVGNAIGMAIAERLLASRFNTADHEIVDHWTYCICSDGDLMEGVSGEASSIAGHLGLSKLIAFYDDNHITIEGDTALAFSEDVGLRYEAYGWHVQRFDDTWTLDDVREAIEAARADERPSMIILRTHIAYGAPHAQDTAEAHGSPLGEDEVRATKRVYGWPEDAHFLVPDEVRAHCDRREEGAALHAAWDERMAAYRKAERKLAGEWDRVMAGVLPDGWEDALPTFAPSDGPLATRAAGGKVLQELASAVPELVGGSADLAPSTSTLMKAFGAIEREGWSGRNFHFGIREHGMGSILNGAQMHGGLRVFGATFMVFSDYMRPSVRLAAIMGAPVVYVWTHDSVWLGEDGPTHQPIEHLMALRAIPNLVSIRPCDAAETAEAWRSALRRLDGPTALQLTRQGLPVLDRGGDLADAAGAARGAYVLADAKRSLDAIVIATGSEVHDALAARETLQADGIGVRVVSMPSWDMFELQDAAYHDEVLPPSVTARVSLEAGITFGWVRFVGAAGRAIGIDRYGASAPGKVVARNLGISPEAVVHAVRELVGGGRGR
jgi:transketolase